MSVLWKEIKEKVQDVLIRAGAQVQYFYVVYQLSVNGYYKFFYFCYQLAAGK